MKGYSSFTIVCSCNLKKPLHGTNLFSFECMSNNISSSSDYSLIRKKSLRNYSDVSNLINRVQWYINIFTMVLVADKNGHCIQNVIAVIFCWTFYWFLSEQILFLWFVFFPNVCSFTRRIAICYDFNFSMEKINDIDFVVQSK